MMAMIRTPFKDLMAIQDRMNRLFDTSIRGEGGEEEVEAAAWTPAVDIYETKDAVVVTVEAPGMKKDQFCVEVKEEVLTIKGERPFEKDVSREQYHRIERAYGKFRRSFILGMSVQSDRVTASYNDGVLEITLPKVEEAKPKKIEITG
jgi:HSP20 family protein